MIDLQTFERPGLALAVKGSLAFIVGRSGMAWRLAAVLAASAVVAAAILLWQGAAAATP